jgi:aromatic-amino-acid transaminase
MSLIIETRKNVVMNKKGGIFAVAARAKKRIQEIGPEKVINSTLGTGLDEAGNPFLIPTFIQVLQDLLANQQTLVCGYTPPGGLPLLNETYPKYILDGLDFPKDVVIKNIPTHGGSGGLSLAIANMSEKSVISHLPHWPNYNLIARESQREIQGFFLQDEKLNFNFASFEETLQRLAKSENRLFIIINSPYSNPTGSSITNEEWLEIARILKKFSVPKILVLDLAYVDFGAKGKDKSVLSFIPQIIEKDPALDLVLIPSASKSFMAYGWRLGSAILITRKKEEAELWYNVFEGAIRGSNSNNATPPQQALSIIFSNAELVRKVEAERQEANTVIQARFHNFQEAAKANGLRISNPSGGYFAMVYLEKAAEIATKLEEKNIFTIPIQSPEGLRISICSLKKDECASLPAEIAELG